MAGRQKLNNVQLISDEKISLLKEFLTVKDKDNIINFSKRHNMISLAYQLDDFTEAEILTLVENMPHEDASELVTYASTNIVETLCEHLSKKLISDIFEHIFKDDIIDIITEVNNDTRNIITNSLSKTAKGKIAELLSHDEDTAGFRMNPDFIRIYETDTVKTIINKIKKDHSFIEQASTLYVISKSSKLVGWLHIKDLLFATSTKKMADVMKKDTISVHIDQNIEEAARIMHQYDLSRLPVVDDKEVLKGSLTSDDVIQVLVEEATEDIHKLSAVSEISNTYFRSSVFELTRSRIIWLLFLSIALAVPELLINNFGDKHSNLQSALAPLLPLVMATAGNAGGQASATIIRAISTGDVKTKDFGKVLFKELRVAFIIATVISGITFGRMYLSSKGNIEYSALVAGSLFLVIIFSKLLGASLPLFAKIIKADPATMAGPIVSTIVDILSIIILFNLFIIILPDYAA